MEIRTLIRLASEIIAYYWPMRNFVHHNPLHGLEDMPFHDAVEKARRSLNGSGYLPNEAFRGYFRSGRILPRHLDAALRARAEHRRVRLGAREISHAEFLRACMVGDTAAPPNDVLAALVERHPDRGAIAALASVLAKLVDAGPIETTPRAQPPEATETLSSWCDRVLGAGIGEQINREMIKWCSAFLDEGHATWAMPRREKGFYSAWKSLAEREWSCCGIKAARARLARLPAVPEDAVLQSLGDIGIEPGEWQNYLALHLAALPGWASFIKWRADQSDYAWQTAYPVDLTDYLAARLWYERELGRRIRQERFGGGGGEPILSDLRKRRPLPNGNAPTEKTALPELAAAWRLIAIARALELEPGLIVQSGPATLRQLLQWADDFPDAAHGRVWLEAFEAGYQEQIVDKLGLKLAPGTPAPLGNGDHARSTAMPPGTHALVRPQAQALFCIDVRSEPLRRNLEATGDYETYGFAGFFAVAIRHQALGSDHETDQFPVILKAKNFVREIPRTYQGQFVSRRRSREKLLDAGHTLLYDLKGNVFTPYVMVESLGWFYSLPMIGKTLFSRAYRRMMERLRRLLVPPVATTLTVDKLGRAEVEEMIAAEQRATTRRALQEKYGERNLNLSLERLEYLRRLALDEEDAGEPSALARSTALSREEEAEFIEVLRHEYGINQGDAFARMERITRTGFTLSEQALTVETVLKMAGLTQNFARLVLICGHGSASENNPFEAALDCGACGGNAGKPNARAVAIMANRPAVREQLARNGLAIPQDTFFIAGQHNTTTDEVELFDLEDLPPTHRKDVLQLVGDAERATARNNQERCSRFPEIGTRPRAPKARREVRRRSSDWSQVRPEWGLSGNAAFIIGRRSLTRGTDLDGRAFLHSYDYRIDPDGRLLDAIMTGPQVVAQWINMEHYFSAADPEVYGSGSKIYHNVVGRFGVMSGPQSDLRIGLAWQTIMSGEMPYHEALRLLTVVEAPLERIDRVIRTQSLLRRLYDNEWLRILAVEPEDRLCYLYMPRHGWSGGGS